MSQMGWNHQLDILLDFFPSASVESQIRPSGKLIMVGNSAGDLFGMVKTWPFQRLSDLQIGDKE